MVMPTRCPSTTSRNSGPTGGGVSRGDDLHGVGDRQAGLEAAHHDVDRIGKSSRNDLLPALAQDSDKAQRGKPSTPTKPPTTRNIPGHADEERRMAMTDADDRRTADVEHPRRSIEAGLHHQTRKVSAAACAASRALRSASAIPESACAGCPSDLRPEGGRAGPASAARRLLATTIARACRPPRLRRVREQKASAMPPTAHGDHEHERDWARLSPNMHAPTSVTS